MIIKKKVVPEGYTGPIDPNMLEDILDFPKYLDEAATQELITQLKAYVDQELGGNS